MDSHYNLLSADIYEHIDIFTNSKDYYQYPTDKDVLLFSRITTPAEDALLTDILKATKLDMNIVAIYKVPDDQQINLGNFFDAPNTKTCICFGLKATDIGIHFDLKAFQPMMLKSKKLLLSPPLADLALNKNLKIELWKCLQTVFSI